MIAVFLFLLLLSLPAFGQSYPQSADVNLYFPQLAVGGDANGLWQTIFVLLNPYSASSADVDLFSTDSQGAGLALDFGSGSSSHLNLSIPPGGTKVLGHMYQLKHGNTFSSNRELDADVWGTFLALGAGYDPYGAAGALGKLGMATGSAGIIAQIFDDILDPHTSFANRLDNLYQTMTVACGISTLKAACDAYKKRVHPNFPPSVPLGKIDSGGIIIK